MPQSDRAGRVPTINLWPPTVRPVTIQYRDTQGLYDATRVASLPPPTGTPADNMPSRLSSRMNCRVEFGRVVENRRVGDRRVENHRDRRARSRHPAGLAFAGVAERAERSLVQQSPGIEMQDQHGVSGATALTSSRVGKRRSTNGNSDHPPTTSTPTAAPLSVPPAGATGAALRRATEPRPNAVHVVRHAPTHDMQVGVVEARYDRGALQVDHHRRVAQMRRQPVEVPNCQHSSLSNGPRRDERLPRVERGDTTAMDDHVCRSGTVQLLPPCRRPLGGLVLAKPRLLHSSWPSPPAIASGKTTVVGRLGPGWITP